MTLFLKESADCYHLLPSNLLDNQNHFQPKTYEFQLHDPKGISHGYRHWYHLRPGISLLVDDYTLNENLVIETSQGQASTCLELSFILLGKNSYEKVFAGQNALFLYEDSGERGWIELQAQEKLLKFDIHIEYSLFQSFITNQIDLLPVSLRDAIKNDDRRELDYLQISRTTPRMQTVLRQILNCPYQGLTKQLYLEGKLLELMALRLEDTHSTVPLNSNTTLKPEQIDSIYQAREIVINNFSNPPSLLALARQVNLNDCTLKKGFQQIFGTTVFGYLHDYRMERAKELLLEANAVNKVARTVGYSSHSAFMSAFRKKFGVNPSVYSRKNSV
ncbi:MAG: helix-turn-helix transcriptional regulator [Rivularia sp. (in: Bacteria)]|nr:helix-turn-helix transcriptional regulator [Rivularia sp. MS3]